MRRKASEYPMRKKVAFLVFLTVGSMFTWSLARNLIDLVRLGSRLDEVRQEVEQLEERNYTLKKRVELVEDPEYLELEVRDKLGLVKPGESLVIIPDELIESGDDESVLRKMTRPGHEENWKEWLSLFI